MTADIERSVVRHRQRLFIVGVWICLLVGYNAWAYAKGLGPSDGARRLLDLFEGRYSGPIAYLIAYALRPLVLFPASFLTLAGGFAFGPVLGSVLTVIASNISASIAYVIGHYFGRGLLEEGASDSLAARWADRMRRNGFEATFLMRLVLVPFDIVNYLAGFLRIAFLPYLAATFLGSLPSSLAVVLAGASVKKFDGAVPSFDPRTLVAAIVLFAISIAIARIVRRRSDSQSLVR